MSDNGATQQWGGLSELEAERRLREEGPNELPSGGRRSVSAIAVEVLSEPMFLLLLASGALYLLMGREHVADALMLLGFVFVIMGITFVQQRRTERALEALRDLSSPRALVIRDGRQRRIAGREVVRGDIVLLAEGDRVPADGLLLDVMNLSVDESLLTGESVPVRKSCRPADGMGHAGGDDHPWVFSGTLVTRGQGVIRVEAVGAQTELGRIGKALQSVKTEPTPLQRDTGRVVRTLAIVGLSICAAVVLLYGFTRGNTAAAWTQGLLTGITMAMAVIPEEFPVVLTIFLALGAWRLSRGRVLTRRMPAVETLGAATVLCVDKTGTLTQNRMAIRQLYARGKVFDAHRASGERLPETFHEILEYGILASKRDPFDPMEKALQDVGERFLARTEHLHATWKLVREYPLSPELLALSHVWKSPDGADFVIAAKGAPEAIWDLCHLGAEEIARLDARVGEMADEGLRVLGVARARFRTTGLPPAQHDFHFEFVGLVGLEDPIRPTAPEAIRECYAAGIRVIMVTGDYPGTARHVARRIGMRSPEGVITGPDLERMSDEELARRIPDVNIFARVAPEQKLRIVTALKAHREVVAMTGDGVNDAPALKAAHIGVAMGGRGADVAREAAALVITDDDFASIVDAVRSGRRIFDNIRKAVAYILAIHVPVVGLSLVPVFFRDWPAILLPVHVVFLELIIDPACSIIFEAEQAEPDIMRRPPRDPAESLFARRTVVLSLLQGATVLGMALLVFTIAQRLGRSQEALKEPGTLAFTTLVVANLCLILTNRSWSRTIVSTLRTPNKALWGVLIGAVLLMGFVLYAPFMQRLFHFDTLHAGDLLLCLVAGVAGIVWFEIRKVLV